MHIATGWSQDRDAAVATGAAYAALRAQLPDEPSLLIAYPSAEYPPDAIVAALRAAAPGVPVHGGTSCRGAMTADGFHSADGYGLVLWGIVDPRGAYGVGAAPIEGDARRAGRDAIVRAIAAAGRPGEPPHLIWLTGVPGHEEAILHGIQDVVGPRVPIAGGSSADNDVAGRWRQFTHDGVHDAAVVVTALYPSTATWFAFQSGYSPTARRGRVTRAAGRTLFEIDHQPAARVYNDWTNGAVTPFMAGGNVLAATSLFPLGRRVEQPNRRTAFRLAHPETVTPDGALTLFADVSDGEELLLMAGTRASLTSRAGRVAQAALDAGRLRPDGVAGALVVYCAGCMLTVQEEMGRVVDSVGAVLRGRPFAGTFTFGEQGCFAGGDSYHGNLMISVVVFAADSAE